MAEEIKPVTVEDVISSGEISPEHLTQWVFNDDVRKLQKIGIARLFNALSDLTTHPGFTYLRPPQNEENFLAASFNEYLHGIRSNFDEHKWEEQLLIFLNLCGFTEDEIIACIRKALIQNANPKVVADIKKAMNDAAESLGMKRVFIADA